MEYKYLHSAQGTYVKAIYVGCSIDAAFVMPSLRGNLQQLDIDRTLSGDVARFIERSYVFRGVDREHLVANV
jgi:hypothetical protein